MKSLNDKIRIVNAYQNNLKNISVEIPHNKITVVTGVSGSGKSSLIYEIIFNEANRRFLQTLPGYVKYLTGKQYNSCVERIDGLKPALSVNQKTTIQNARSTVGTLSGLYDYLRLFFARFATNSANPEIKAERCLFSFNSPAGACPTCKGLGLVDKIDENKLVENHEKSLREGALVITAPNGYIIYSQVTMEVLNTVCNTHGFSVDIPWKNLTPEEKKVVLFGSDKIKIPYGKHTLESRMKWTGITAKPRPDDFYKGIMPVMEEILKRDRNENILRFATSAECPECKGSRLKSEALEFKINNKSIHEICSLEIDELLLFFKNLSLSDTNGEDVVADQILKLLSAMQNLGLGYLSPSRISTSLSGGEAQRIRLSALVNNGLKNTIYILDEPSIGLHPRDNQKLIDLMRELRDAGNTVICVEHNEEFISSADHIIEIGPGAGKYGGELIKSFENYSCPEKILQPKNNLLNEKKFTLNNVNKNNLKNICVNFYYNSLNVITGVSGSGKSSLAEELINIVKSKKEHYNFSRIIEIDQSPIGRTPKSNPATYTGMFDHIRDLFASLPESKSKGLTKSSFSFNLKGGRCETCGGAGIIETGMHFIGNVETVCDSCSGKRFSLQVLDVKYKSKNIFDVLELYIDEAIDFFCDNKKILKYLESLYNLGLGYIRLGQSSTSLSGGEAQRLKLATHLVLSSEAKTLYVLDEPTTGLHKKDISVLLKNIQNLILPGNTVVIIEHDKDIILQADHIIDLGPESGAKGGKIIFEGSPDNLLLCEKSVTGKTLALCKSINEIPPVINISIKENSIWFKGIKTNNLKNIDLSIIENNITVITGISGSGKSSLAYDTVFSESQKRFSESLPAYIRTFLKKAGNAEFEDCSKLPPAIATTQKPLASNQRSTVGTFTGIYDFYRLLYSRAGIKNNSLISGIESTIFSFNSEHGACSACGGLGSIVACDTDLLITHPKLSIINGAMNGTKTGKFYGDPHGRYVALLKEVGRSMNIDFSVPWCSLNNSEKTIAMHGAGKTVFCYKWEHNKQEHDQNFEFKSEWKGFSELVNEEYYRKHADKRQDSMHDVLSECQCNHCNGSRLKKEALEITFAGLNIFELSATSISRSILYFEEITVANKPELTQTQLSICKNIIPEIIARLKHLEKAGLGYLNIHRTSGSLSGGEAQRLTIAGQLGSGLCGILYVLDEPANGLSSEEILNLTEIFVELKNKGNTLLIVDHRPEIIACADHIIELGPKSGSNGGEITFSGSYEMLSKSKESKLNSTNNTAETRVKKSELHTDKFIDIQKAKIHNLKEINVRFPVNEFSIIVGPSGSGKSTLLEYVIHKSAKHGRPCNCETTSGLGEFSEIVFSEKTPAWANIHSNVLTYCDVFDELKKIFASTDYAKSKQISQKLFSLNTDGGRCSNCSGVGLVRTSMDYFADVSGICEECSGKRFKPEILNCLYNGNNISDFLNMTVQESLLLFNKNIKLSTTLNTLQKVGLGYVKLGQQTSFMSYGEQQRLKIAYSILHNKGKVLFLFDEPSSGLGIEDVDNLKSLFTSLLNDGHTIIAADHNAALKRFSTHTLELGPGGGENGGTVIYCGESIR